MEIDSASVSLVTTSDMVPLVTDQVDKDDLTEPPVLGEQLEPVTSDQDPETDTASDLAAAPVLVREDDAAEAVMKLADENDPVSSTVTDKKPVPESDRKNDDDGPVPVEVVPQPSVSDPDPDIEVDQEKATKLLDQSTTLGLDMDPDVRLRRATTIIAGTNDLLGDIYRKYFRNN